MATAVDHLGENGDLHQRKVGQQDHARARHDQDGVEPVKYRCFAEFPPYAGFESQALANRVSSRKRQDRGGKQRGIEQSHREQNIGVIAGQRPQRLGGVFARP